MLKQPTELILITHMKMSLLEISVSTVFIHRLICVSVNEGFLIGEFIPTQINCARGKHNVSVFTRLSVTPVTCITFTSILLTHIAVSAQMCQSFHKELFLTSNLTGGTASVGSQYTTTSRYYYYTIKKNLKTTRHRDCKL